MAGELATIGMLFAYGVETVAGTKPTSFTKIEGALNLPEIPLEPQQIDVTPLDETTAHRFIPGLANDGNAKGIQFNLNDAFKTAWGSMMTAYGNLTSGLSMWYEFYHPGMTDGFFFTGTPSELGFGGADVDSPNTVTGYVTANEIKGWSTAVTPS